MRLDNVSTPVRNSLLSVIGKTDQENRLKSFVSLLKQKGFLSISFNFHRQTEDSVANVIDVNLDLIQAKRENFRPGSNNRGPFLHVISDIFLIKNYF